MRIGSDQDYAIDLEIDTYLESEAAETERAERAERDTHVASRPNEQEGE